MDFVKKYYIYFLVGLVIILSVISIISKNDVQSAEISIDIEDNERSIYTSYIYIDIKGAVLNPGVYKIEKDSRLFQVIALAGGLSDDADENAMNFSIILRDQDVVYVPTIGEEYPLVTIVEELDIGGVVNINSATKEVLETLPGIGPATAQNIIDYRDENGDFLIINDIMNVSGIGESTFQEIKEFITV